MPLMMKTLVFWLFTSIGLFPGAWLLCTGLLVRIFPTKTSFPGSDLCSIEISKRMFLTVPRAALFFSDRNPIVIALGFFGLVAFVSALLILLHKSGNQ